MTRYIKGKDGKFAGSIGEGKTSVPTASPTPPRLVRQADPHDLSALIEAPGPAFTDSGCPDYCESDYAGSPKLNIPTKPSGDVIDSWPEPQEQRNLTHHINSAIVLISEIRTSSQDSQLSDGQFLHRYNEIYEQLGSRSEDYEQMAQTLRSQGLHHQAYAAEWAAAVTKDVQEHMSMSLSNLDDDEHWEDIHSDRGNYPDLTTHDEANCLRECGHWFLETPLRNDAQILTSGAVLCDYLPAAGYDPDAAAVLATLSPSGVWRNPADN